MKIICDIDGTVADNTHREHHIAGVEKDYDKFYDHALIALDKPIEKALKVIPHILDVSETYEFVYLTGRPESTRQATYDWLNKYDIYAPIYMRANNDRSRAVEYKERFVRTYGSRMLFIDDDPRNEAMYWKYGIPLHAPDCWNSFMINKVDVWPKVK
jgi:hypothetical protein